MREENEEKKEEEKEPGWDKNGCMAMMVAVIVGRSTNSLSKWS